MTTPRAPAHLRPSTRRWWRQIVDEYELGSHHVHLLTLAGEALDRLEQARLLLEEAGPVYLDRFGAPRKHPAVSIEENARLQFARIVREIDLDAESLPPPRPPRRGGG